MYTIQLIKNMTPVWGYSTDNIEEIAGMAAVSQGILKDINKTQDIPITIKTNANLKEFRRINNHPNDLLNIYNCRDVDNKHEICDIIFNDIGEDIGIWVDSGNNRISSSSLYKFKTDSFITGMMSFALLFDMDFRVFIYDKPFRADGSDYIYNSYSFDKNYVYKVLPENTEVDEEEAGDDNVQNPYADNDLVSPDV